jgi:hypothetical protein
VPATAVVPRRCPSSSYSSNPTPSGERTRSSEGQPLPQPVPGGSEGRSAAHDGIPEGPLQQATYRRDAAYRRSLGLADVASAVIAVLIGVPVLGDDALNPVAIFALPVVLLVGKLSGIYDRDEHLLRKTTLDEVPTPVLGCDAVRVPDLAWRGSDRRWSVRP